MIKIDDQMLLVQNLCVGKQADVDIILIPQYLLAFAFLVCFWNWRDKIVVG